MKEHYKLLLKSKKYAIILYASLLIGLNILTIIYPLYLNHILENISQLHSQDMLLFVSLSIVIPILSSCKDRVLYKVSNSFSAELVSHLAHQIFKKDALKLNQFSSFYIFRSINNYAMIFCNFFMYCLMDIVVRCVASIMMVMILCSHHLLLGIVVLALNILRIGLIYLFNHRLKKVSKDQQVSSNRFYQIVTSYIKKLKTIMTRNKGQACINQLDHLANQNYNATVIEAKVKGFVLAIDQSSIWMIQILSILCGLILSSWIPLTFYTLQLAFFYARDIANCLNAVTSSFPIYAILKANKEIVDELLDIEAMKDDGCQESFSTIKLQNLAFSYPSKKQATIENLNYTFNKGNIYFIRGENGTGKSTLLKVISGYYTGYQGNIYLDDISLANYNIETYQSQLLSVLSQHDLLFEGTVFDNLIAKNKEEVKEICELLEINELDKKVAFGGNNLSGGQRRKILLARLFLEIQRNQPSLIILDEPTYALDPEVASRVMKQIETYATNHIVLVVSHDDIEHFNNYRTLELVR